MVVAWMVVLVLGPRCLEWGVAGQHGAPCMLLPSTCGMHACASDIRLANPKEVRSAAFLGGAQWH